MITSAEPISKTIELVFNLDLSAGIITCDDLGVGAGEDIPTWLWQDMLRRREWRSLTDDNDIEIHVSYHVDFELEDQRPDPNGIVPIAKGISETGTTRLVSARAESFVSDESSLAEELLDQFRHEIGAYAEDSYQ